ncbi:type II toxin-antitoxin system HipA family toxin [Citricoccus parietis]
MQLAKFPKTSDPGDVHLWEMVAIRLQSLAGITVQPSRLMPLGEYRNIFLTHRFDRDGDRRIPYMSMRSALQLTDGEHASYEHLARELSLISAAPREDARELFARAAFGAMVNNIDDHMRNHGLLHTGRGWRLAPSFDVNPSVSGYSDTPLTDRGDLVDRDIGDLLEAAGSFRLTPADAVAILRRVAQAVSHWPEEARGLGADHETIDAWKRAFTGPNVDRALALN